LLQLESFRRGKWFSANKNPLIVLPLKSEKDRKPSFKKQKERERQRWRIQWCTCTVWWSLTMMNSIRQCTQLVHISCTHYV